MSHNLFRDNSTFIWEMAAHWRVYRGGEEAGKESRKEATKTAEREGTRGDGGNSRLRDRGFIEILRVRHKSGHIKKTITPGVCKCGQRRRVGGMNGRWWNAGWREEIE